jgi:rod shape-determining protein MreD
MKYLVGVPLMLFAAVCQSTVLAQLRFFGGTLDLVLVLTLSWALTGEWQGGAIWGLVGGLGLDLLSGAPLGLTAVAQMTVAYLASLTEGRLWRSHVLLPLAAILIGSAIYHLITLILLNLTDNPIPIWESLWRITLPSVLINTVLMLPGYFFIRWLRYVVEPPAVSA